MSQEVINNEEIQTQINAPNSSINFHKKSRLSKRFEKLKEEIQNNKQYLEVLEELKWYLTQRDGIDVTQKLADGGFSEDEILEATRKKEKYWKKSQKYQFFESAQKIDLDLLARIKMNFEAYVKPLIQSVAEKDKIMIAIVENVINPILEILNEDGADDELLDYNADDIYGMIYHLTGNCHLYWTNYDNI